MIKTLQNRARVLERQLGKRSPRPTEYARHVHDPLEPDAAARVAEFVADAEARGVRTLVHEIVGDRRESSRSPSAFRGGRFEPMATADDLPDAEPMPAVDFDVPRRDARLLSMIESEPRLKGQGVIVWRVVKPSPEFEEERQSAMARRARGTPDHPDDEPPPEYPDETDQPVSIAPGLRRQQEWARARRIIDNQTSAPGLDSPRSAEKAGRRVSARVIPLINPNGTRRR